MKEFKGTKGKWIYDEIKKGIVNENVKGLLVTAWNTYNSDIYEERLENESWLSMRERTKIIRDNCELEQKANAKLIASAPEMFEELKETIIDLKILKNQIIDANKTNHLFDGMTELMEKWIERKQQLLTKITD